jgi:hypothetical protein
MKERRPEHRKSRRVGQKKIAMLKLGRGVHVGIN